MRPIRGQVLDEATFYAIWVRLKSSLPAVIRIRQPYLLGAATGIMLTAHDSPSILALRITFSLKNFLGEIIVVQLSIKLMY